MTRITEGKDCGAYYHECLIRGRPDLLVGIKRKKIKGDADVGNYHVRSTPNFYLMPPILPPSEDKENTSDEKDIEENSKI